MSEPAPPAKPKLRTIGWREWVALPDLGVPWIKVKVDTGARISAMHAFDLENFQKNGEDWLRFAIHPRQRRTRPTVICEARLHDERVVRSSNGVEQLRPIILTRFELGNVREDLELSLTSRDSMGFRMLLGRQAMRGHFRVDPGRSFRSGRPVKPWSQK